MAAPAPQEEAPLAQLPAGLRARAAQLRRALDCARSGVRAGGEELLDLARAVERELREGARGRAEEAALATEVATLERRVGGLRSRPRAQDHLDAEAGLALGPRTARQQMDAVALGRSLPQLREEVAAAEREVAELRALEARSALLLSRRKPLDEAQSFEWYGMTVEDRPELVAACVVESECDAWERALHELLAPLVGGGGAPGAPPSQGVRRLETELDTIGSVDRARRSDLLRRLGREGGQWAHIFGELSHVYALVDRLRVSNDALVDEMAGRRWRELGVAVPGTAPAAVPAPRQREVVFQPDFSGTKGPRFSAPVAPKAKPAAAKEAAREAMPSAVISDPRVWETTMRERGRADSETGAGLGFLHSTTSTQRFRPAAVVSPGFEETAWDAWEKEEQRQQEAQVGSVDVLARRVAAEFREPLSSAVEGSQGGAIARRRQRPAPDSRPRPRSGWVTFDATAAGGGGACRRSASAAC